MIHIAEGCEILPSFETVDASLLTSTGVSDSVVLQLQLSKCIGAALTSASEFL